LCQQTHPSELWLMCKFLPETTKATEDIAETSPYHWLSVCFHRLADCTCINALVSHCWHYETSGRNIVESVDSSVYLGSLKSLDGQCLPDLTRRICLACSVISVSKTDMERQAPDTWYQALYIPDTCFVCFTICHSWTLLSANVRTPDVFHQKCETAVSNPMVQPSPKWWSTTTDRSDFTVPSPILSVFGHAARLEDDTPANIALQLHINVSLNRPPDHMWHRPPGRPWNKWLDQL